MGRKKPKARRSSKTPKRPVRRPGGKTLNTPTPEPVRQLDQAVQEFDGAVDGVQSSLEKLRECLPALVTVESRRDRLRRVKPLAADGILDMMQRLAAAFDACADAEGLPERLQPFRNSARVLLEHLCHTFEIDPVHQPGDMLTVTQERVREFDWSADRSGQPSFPVDVEILRSGWKSGNAVLVLPQVRVCQPASVVSV